ncbi:unnamed protein product [Acanthoscelides obtectus]|uniref:Uncharacterized protein n=1 Tax=Acanthoscelides obtectus TaxID=200917 RepID=A0A9P0P461_ACAOB|nr:unnamed protein product [Acanthoscelides obtectus]CAK1622843.1 hypothetical protein AOBTE_LOCUS1694 [Acanthoscelides obtectus]
MLPRLIFVVALAVIFCGVVFGAPKPFKSEKDFENAIVQFLSQDIEFLNTLEKAAMIDDDRKSIQKRQADTDAVDTDTVNVDTTSNDSLLQKAFRLIRNYLLNTVIHMVAGWILG